MPKFIITEMQHVLAIREVEAENSDQAYDLFCEGEGKEVGRDGEVTGSSLVDITQVDEAGED